MEDESEQRFHSIMDKLFHAPKSKPTSNSSSSSSGKNPLNPAHSNSRGGGFRFQSSIVAADKSLQQAPLCRPWNREDLLKRLTTFKAMTWFGKPKVVNAINCARRGWVNVDTDIIACESCGARLLFSTPSSWAQQQIEKAALVFSLKLDSGHKLLCPWIDNACDENLAKFPPMQAPALVDQYRERVSSLLQLVALPIISSSAIDMIRSPQLENFIRQSLTLECGDGSADTFTPAYLGNECEGVSTNMYYQALKLISLCGWEPRSLPYMVDCTNLPKQSSKDANGQDVHVYSASMNEIIEATEFTKTSGEQCDPSSVVLDCKLCGASVGLWAFSSVPRPVESFRLVGEVGGENDSESSGPPQIESSNDNQGDTTGVQNYAPNGGSSLKDRSTFNVTIAGGPSPTKQNFKATISLPIIGQNLRARFSSDFNFRDRVLLSTSPVSMSDGSFRNGKDHMEDTDNREEQAEDTEKLKRKRQDDGHLDTTSDDQLPNNNNAIIVKECTVAQESDRETSLDKRNGVGQGLFHEDGNHDTTTGNTVESTQEIAHWSSQNDNLYQIEENTDPVAEQYLVRDTSMTTADAEFSIKDGEMTENGSSMIVAADYCSHQESSAGINYDNASIIDHREADSVVQSTPSTQTNSLGSDVIENQALTIVNTETACDIAKNLKQQPLRREMEFDAIWQHRHFCPWISSTGGAAPGWQQTLKAIQRQRERSYPLLTKSTSSAPMIEVDDPIASVRKLFMSPSPKRIKSAHKPD